MSAQEQRIYHRVQVAAHHLRKVADRRVLEATRLTTAQVAVLATVAQHGPCRQQVVASVLGYNESAITAMVRRLVESGHLQRERDATDARARVVSLSPAGNRSLSRAVPAFGVVNARIEAVLDDGEIEQLADLLDRLQRGLDADQADW